MKTIDHKTKPTWVVPWFVDTFGRTRQAPAQTVQRLSQLDARPAPHAAGRPVAALQSPPAQWGISVQLYTVHTERSWGIGDFTDLADIGRRVAELGGGCLLVNPLGAVRPGGHPEPSPYSPTSRRFLNLLYIDPEQLPGAELVDLGPIRHAADAASSGIPTEYGVEVDYDLVWQTKLRALEAVWGASDGRWDRDVEAWAKEVGSDLLRRFAVWSVLAERHRGPWWDWPDDARRPSAALVAGVEEADSGRIGFWEWCQWVADLQLARAGDTGVDLVLDVPVGIDTGGFDGWDHQDQVVGDFEVGCPADHNNPDGQRWGLAAIDPAESAATGHQLWRETIRAIARHADGIRIDHVAGLWRQWWVPRDGGDPDGVYVRIDGDALVSILTEEIAATGRPIWVVGEDMGTVPDEVPHEMAHAGMLGYRVSGRTPIDEFPELCMGAVATHDQATIAGIVAGSDLTDCQRYGKLIDLERAALVRRRLLEDAGLAPDTTVSRIGLEACVREAHRQLARSAARVLLVSLEDLAMSPHRPNLPGVTARPNWRIRLPSTPGEILDTSLACDVLEILNGARPRSDGAHS